MNITKTESIGIISCPGAEHFSEKIIHSLQKSYLKRSTKTISDLGKRFEKSREEIVKTRKLFLGLNGELLAGDRSPTKVKAPRYKVEVGFSSFANGELKAEIIDSIRGKDIYIIQDCENHQFLSIKNSTKKNISLSINDHLLMLFATIDAATRADAGSITLVLPVFPYSRQHKRKGREPLTAAWFGRVCEFQGVKRIITLDIHSNSIENCFNRLRLENLHASYQILLELCKIINLNDAGLVVVSPDIGATTRNRFFANCLKKPLALFYKERDYSKISGSAEGSNIVETKLLGDVANKVVFMSDDIIGTGGTLIKALEELKRLKAKKVIIATSLPVFSENSIEIFNQAYKDGLFYRVIGTDAVYHGTELTSRPWFTQAGIANLFAETISRLHLGRSVSTLLDNSYIIQKLLNETGLSDKKKNEQKA